MPFCWKVYLSLSDEVIKQLLQDLHWAGVVYLSQSSGAYFLFSVARRGKQRSSNNAKGRSAQFVTDCQT
jgi:hypothetical protein